MGNVSRDEFFHDPGAPLAEIVAPSVFAAVRDERGRLLQVRRLDNGNWELPGGQVDGGDTAIGALRREVAEEAGITIGFVGENRPQMSTSFDRADRPMLMIDVGEN